MTGKKGETPSNEALMPEQGAMFRERTMQPALSFSEAFQLVAFLLALYALWRAMGFLPNRVELGPARTRLHVEAVDLDGASFKGLALAGAWELRSTDPRFGGYSALALANGNFLAIGDRGAVASFPKPGAGHRPVVTIQELPDGPGSKRYVWNRDTEALARDPLGRGWWVGFEVRHELWLFDRDFTRGLKRVQLGAGRWPVNEGVEGLVALPGPELLIFVERSGRMFRMRGSNAVAEAVAGGRGGISDAIALPDARIALIERSFGIFGFRNVLAIAEGDGEGLRVRERFDLPAGMLTNLEGMAAEPLRGGATRLWIISDDNFLRPLRTLLLAVDLPPKRVGD